jgi:hypothetical protein
MSGRRIERCCGSRSSGKETTSRKLMCHVVFSLMLNGQLTWISGLLSQTITQSGHGLGIPVPC